MLVYTNRCQISLTDTAIRNTKSANKIQKLSDGNGLQLWIVPTGSKLWRYAYRYSGKQKLLALGKYPLFSLKDAREGCDKARRLLADGIDPSSARREAKLTDATCTTFKAIADEYTEKLRREGRALSTLSKTEWLIDLAGDLHDLPMAKISAQLVLSVLKPVENRERLETAKRLRTTIGSIFRYAVATARADNDPTHLLRGALLAPKVTHRPAITDKKAFKALFQTIAGYDGSPEVRIGLQLLALLFPRPGELRAAEWGEFDLKKEVWTIPASRMKMRREHKVPLASQTIALLKQLHLITGQGQHVLPSPTSKARYLSDNTFNAALRRMGYGKNDMTPHGFRASASSILNESGKFSPDIIERQLAHIERNDVRRAYHRAEYWDKRVEMMNWWAEFVTG